MRGSGSIRISVIGAAAAGVAAIAVLLSGSPSAATDQPAASDSLFAAQTDVFERVG